MPTPNTTRISADGLPELPQLLARFLQLDVGENSTDWHELQSAYPVFFSHLLEVINADHFNLNLKLENLQQALDLSGRGAIASQLLMQLAYRSFNQYRIKGLDVEQYWHDTLRQAVAARLLGELTGQDAADCFIAGFLQGTGVFLLFFEQPEKGSLWAALRQREPEARLQMEQNIFGKTHINRMHDFFYYWHLHEIVSAPVSSCFASDTGTAAPGAQLCRVLMCSNWLAAVYEADDTSFVMQRAREMLEENFRLEAYRTEELLTAIPDETDMCAQVMGFDIGEPVLYSQILYRANLHLNESNLNFQELTHRLDRALEERDRLSAEINRELNLAREIQQSMLPKNHADEYPVSGINISAKTLSGDFYDFFELDSGDVLFNLGDVSGKGVNAALLMAKAISLFRCLGKRIYDPGDLLYEINNELCETSIHGMFVTMVAGRYSPDSGEVVLVNAGNPPALLMKEDGLCVEYEATSPPLGIMEDTSFDEYRFNLDNDSLYVYSDGVIEGYIHDGTTLEVGGLFKLIAQMNRQSPSVERLRSVTHLFTESKQSLRDDVTLLLLEKKYEGEGAIDKAATPVIQG